MLSVPLSQRRGTVAAPRAAAVRGVSATTGTRPANYMRFGSDEGKVPWQTTTPESPIRRYQPRTGGICADDSSSRHQKLLTQTT